MLNTMVMYPTFSTAKRKGKESRKKKIKMINRSCPFIQEPYDGALCAGMTRQNIESAMYYCGTHFEQCDTYKRWS